MQVVDFVSEMAVNIIIDFVQNPPCPEAKHYLVKGPEEVAIKALEKALNSLVCVGARPKGPVH